MTAAQRDEEVLFNAARQIGDPAARAQYLREATGGDEELLRRVEALLAVHDAPDRLLDRPAAAGGVTGAFGPALGDETDSVLACAGAGTQIGPYKLLQQIGEGGMGTVFMAEQTQPVQRKVALKVIKPGMDSRQVIARFEAERQALALMDHVNIARVLDAGATAAGRPYFVMELIHGVPITRYCDDNHLTLRERLELFIPVCQAVQHAHQKGIIHRDLKPSNVLVTLYDGKPVPKVIDFGVAKAIEQKLTERTLFTQYGTLVGTLEYMSPEQAELSALGIDTRSDIYSLGVLLYELLTGSTPLSRRRLKEAAYAEILRIIKEEEPQKPSTRLNDSGEALASISAQRHTEPGKLTKLVRGELDWIVMKTLEKDRNRRYETANGLAKDVQRYLTDEPVQACPPSVRYRLRKFARRNKAALATGALVFTALVAGLVILAVSNVLVTHERNARDKALAEKGQALEEKQGALTLAQANYAEAKHQERLAKEQQRIATKQTVLAKRHLHAAQMNLAMQAWRAGKVPRVLELLEGQRPRSASDDDLRGFEWFYLWRLCNGGRLHLNGHTQAVLAVCYSPDGKTLASASGDGTVRLWDTATGRARMTLRGHTGAAWDVAFSPDGTMLASGGKGSNEMILWNATTGKRIHTMPGPVNGLAFSPDSRTILGGGRPTQRWDVASGARRATFSEKGVMLGMLPDGKTVVTLADQFLESCDVRFWDAESGTRRLTIPVPRAPAAALSPDGTRIATSAKWSVQVWDTATGTEQARYSAQTEVRGLAFSPDGKWLATGQEDRRVVVRNLKTGEQLGEDAHRDVVWAVAFAPNGQSIASATLGGHIKLWDLKSPKEAASCPIAGVAALRFSADSGTLLVGNTGPTSMIDVSAAKEAALFPWGGVSAISNNGETAARLDGDTHVVFLEGKSGRAIARLPLPKSKGGQPGVSLSPNGKRAALFFSARGVPGDHRVMLWDLDTRQTRMLTNGLGGSSINCAEFSPDGKLLAAGFMFQWVVIWDLETGNVKRQFAQPPAMMKVLSLAFSPDSKALAVGADMGAVTLWDVHSGQQLAAFRGHTSNVHALTFSPDGAVLATAGADTTVRLWDVHTAQERCMLSGHAGRIYHIQFSPDGNTLAAAGHHPGTVTIWRAATGPAALAPRRAPSTQGGEPSRGKSAAPVALPPGAIELTVAGLREGVRCWPDNADLHRRLGRLLQGQNQIAEAASSFQEVIRLKPDDSEAFTALAQVLNQQGKLAEEEAALREAIRLSPNQPGRHEKLGWLLAKQKKFAEAETEFREAIRLDVQSQGGHHGLGRALLGQKKPLDAIAPLREAIRLGSTDHWVYEALGWALVKQEQSAEAEAAFREVVRLRPDLAEGYFGLGRTLVDQEKFADAEKALRDTLRISPTHPWARKMLVQALVSQGKSAEAEELKKKSEQAVQGSEKQEKPE